MINQLDKSLRRLLKESRAQAAVLWVLRNQPAGASVLTSCPAELVPAGTEWPVPAEMNPDHVEHDPARLAAVVPTTLRLRLAEPPSAAESFALGDDIFLLIVWCDADAPAEISDVLRHVIRNEVGYLAQLIEDGRFARGESDRQLAVLNALQEGVVSVDPHLGQANVNAAAASLLGLPGDQIPASLFAAAMAALAGRAVNGDDAAEAGQVLQRDPMAEIDELWRFADPPTHLRVRSRPIRVDAFAGRIWTFTDESELAQALDASEAGRRLIRATADAMIDPQVVLQVVEDDTGKPVDLLYLDANRATTDYLGIPREDLLGRTALTHLPNLEGSGLLAAYAHCAETGEPVVLDGFSYFNEILDDGRRYDIRATQVGPGVVNLTWRDVTERARSARRIADSEERFRLLAENSADVITRVRDGVFVWVSPSIEAAFGAPPEYWIGRRVSVLIPPDGQAAQLGRLHDLAAGRTVLTRTELVGADGVRHWTHLHAKPIRDADGALDGFTASIRIIDAEVAAEQSAAQARARQAAADALYRKSMDSSAVGMCLADTVGNFIDVNQSMCDFFGYPQAVLMTKTWMELTAPDYLQADIDQRAATMAGQIDSYRMVKEFIHADGHPIWGDLSIGCIRAPDGQVEVFIGQITDITAEVIGRRELEEARAAQVRADTRYRRLMDNSTVAMNVCDARGRFQIVNPAMSEFFGYDEAALLTKTWEELTAPEFLEIDRAKMTDVLDGRTDGYRLTKEYIHADGHPIWGDLSISCIRDPSGAVENFIAQIVDVTAEVTAKRLEDEANTRYRRLIDNSPIPMNICSPDGHFQSVNTAMCEFFGYDAEVLKTMTWQHLTAPAYLDGDLAAMADLSSGKYDVYRVLKQYIHADGHHIWGDLSVSCVRDATGRPENFVAQIIDVTAKIEAEAREAKARALQAKSDARYRRLMDTSNIGMTLITPDGRFDVVNPALCTFFGYDAATLSTKTWQELTAAEFLDSDLSKVEDILAGRIDSYRMVKQYIHADGHLIWGDLSVSCLRDDAGQVERFVSQITDITAEVEARRQIAQRDQQNRVLARRLQAQTDRMKAELDSAATYVASLLPDVLAGPPVHITSSYLPSRELGGDCFGYSWADDDHLIVYLIDVSGHGIAPALMSISALNMLRSETLPRYIALDPPALLGELNSRFQMESQGGNYFTIFYAVYHRPTRTLRYASAGHPPALLLPADGPPVHLATGSPPVGIFSDTVFVGDSHGIPAGARLLIYSDGAFELPLPDGRHGDLDDFVDLCVAQAASPDWTLEGLTAALLDRTIGHQFEDDCSLILLEFD